MKKKTQLLTLLGILVLMGCSLVFPVSAQLVRPTSPYSLNELMNGIKNATWISFTIIVLVSFVMAAVLFLSAQGDPEKLKTARRAFTWGVAGVVVGIIAFTIITIVGRLL